MEKSHKLTKTYDISYYNDLDKSSYASSKFYVKKILNNFEINSVADFGCGNGSWLKSFKENSVDQLIGIDGPWNNGSELKKINAKFLQLDFTKDKLSIPRVDLCLCLEVIEHIDFRFSQNLINFLTQSSDLVLFSGAYLHQGGLNHINEKAHSFWANKFISANFIPYDFFRPEFWNNEKIGFWYRQNCFLYVKKKSLHEKKLKNLGISPIENIYFMDCIHPELYKIKCGEGISFKKTLLNLLPSFYKAIKRRLNG